EIDGGNHVGRIALADRHGIEHLAVRAMVRADRLQPPHSGSHHRGEAEGACREERQTQVHLPAASLLFTLATASRIMSGSAMAPTTIWEDRKSTRLNSSHVAISYAVFCLKKKTTK